MVCSDPALPWLGRLFNNRCSLINGAPQGPWEARVLAPLPFDFATTVDEFVRRLLPAALHHELRVEYHAVSLQAVMVALLGSDAIDRALRMLCLG